MTQRLFAGIARGRILGDLGHLLGWFWMRHRGIFLDRAPIRQAGSTQSPLPTMSVAKYANLPYIVRGSSSIMFASRFG